MIGKLRKKFIIVSMLSVTLVLAVLIAVINIFNYREVINNADNVLDILTANQGVFPPDTMPDPVWDDPAWNDLFWDDPFGFPGDMRDGRRNRMSPEMRYETRFFSIVLDSDGNAVLINTGSIAAVDSDEAAELAQSVFRSGKTKGFLYGYRFRKNIIDDVTLVVFYDCGRSLDNARSFLWISIIISAIALLVVFALIAISSKAVIKPVAETYEKQKRFITDAGHELKTPLAVINADCDVLEMENENGENEWLADIRKQTERLTELTGRLIYLAKTEEGSKTEMLKIDFPLSDVVSEEVESFKGPAKSSDKTIETSITPDLTYNGDQKAVTQLVSILMDNAIKYSPEGGTVKVSLGRNGSKTVLAVTNDTREAVSKEDLKRMFDRFYRTDKSRNSETGGYGIGLSIAKGITESHGGKIHASGSGNKLTVTAEL